jgi:hypothetical protein
MVRIGLTLASLLFAGLAAFAQPRPASPPPTAKYQVTLRYRIPNARNLHVAAYDKLIADLQKINFEFQPPLAERPESDREDTSKNYLKGLVLAQHVGQLRVNPSIANILLVPEDVKLPDQPEAPVRVRLELAGNMDTKEQHDLSDQTRAILELVGFREAAGYDHRGYYGRAYTRLVGQVPVNALELLLKDLRMQPAGWFESRFVLDKLPAPIRDVNPVHVVEVLSDSEPVPAVKDLIPPGVVLSRLGDFAEVRVDSPSSKVSPDLWDVMLDAAKKSEFVRVQVLFAGEPTVDDIRRELGNGVPTFQIEGQLGNAALGKVPAGQIMNLASIPAVTLVRRPHVTLPDVYAGSRTPVELKAVLKHTGLEELHQAGHRGQGIKIGVLDRDFRQWEKFVESKQLPAKTRLVDLTAEGTSDIRPLPEVAGDAPGHGTLAAVAVAQGAPNAEIVLIRIDPNDLYQIPEVIGYLKGGRFSETIIRRFDEFQVARADLLAKRRVLADERQFFLRNFPTQSELDEADEFAFLGPAFGWIFSPRDWHRQKMAYQEQLERANARREGRYQQLLQDVRSLAGIDVLINPYTWNQGFPLGGSSPLSRWFELRGKDGPLVLQSAGNLRGQTWTGLYRDANKNGVMEFAGPETPLPADRWTRELNFLAWQPYGNMNMRAAEIPEKTKLRLSFQWREPHEADYFVIGDNDPYRQPLMNIRVTLLRQRDPGAEKVSADSFEVVARSNPFPQRLQHVPGGDVYEHVIDAVIEKKGVYAVQIEKQQDHVWLIEGLESQAAARPTFVLKRGLNPTGLRPANSPTLPVLEKNWEFRPRLFVEAIDSENRLMGRPQFADFATDQGSLGIPGDSRGLFTVTSMDLENRTVPYAVVGTPPYLELAKQHLLFVPDHVGDGMGCAFGTPLATSFTAGAAASMLSSGMTTNQVETALRQVQGYALRVRR